MRYETLALVDARARPRARQEGLVVRELDGETLVYDLDAHRAHCLNETAAFVWRRCDGEHAPASIAAGLDYEEEVVWHALEELWKLDLLEGDEAPVHEKVISRRLLLKRIGVTAAVALPLAATIAVPAASAGSCTPTCGACEDTSTCCPGLTCCSSQCKTGCNDVCPT